MKRPQQKETDDTEIMDGIRNCCDYAYNAALDDMDKYLPDFNEIMSLLPPQDATPSLDMGVYAKSIHRRIRE